MFYNVMCVCMCMCMCVCVYVYVCVHTLVQGNIYHYTHNDKLIKIMALNDHGTKDTMKEKLRRLFIEFYITFKTVSSLVREKCHIPLIKHSQNRKKVSAKNC
jgi:hypothetical protein